MNLDNTLIIVPLILSLLLDGLILYLVLTRPAKPAAVDVKRIAQALTSEAIMEFKTDRINTADFTAFVRMRYLLGCATYGLNDGDTDAVIEQARELLDMDKALVSEGEIAYLFGG